MGGRPVIGVTGPDKGGFTAWLMTGFALRRSGAVAVRISASRQFDRSRLDGIVIGGGTDVDPFHYGEHEVQARSDDIAPHRSLIRWLVDWVVSLTLGVFRAIFAVHSETGYDPERDHLEKELILYALEHRLPVLGICRGAQLMNVVLGGSLHRDIGHFYTEDTGNIRSVLPRKSVTISSSSHLHDILGARSCFVNALHRQSINKLGEDIVVSAVETNGVVQAVEKCGHPFFLGVQWHPEYMPQSRTQQGLFRGIARHAKQRNLAD